MFKNIAALAALFSPREHHKGRTRYSAGQKRSRSIADKPHKHLREIARRTTKPGTPERRAAMEAARRG